MLPKEHSTNGRLTTAKIARDSELDVPFHQGCPYFALVDDPDTSLLFPSSLAYCHRAKPPAPIHLNHQETHCLTARHKSCPVYLKPGPLPTSLRGQDVILSNGRRRGTVVLGIVALVLLAALAAAWGSGLINLNTLTGSQPADGNSLAAGVLPTATATATPLMRATSEATAVSSGSQLAAEETPNPTATAIPPTQTHTPEPTPTSTPPPTATPIPTAKLPATFTPVPPPSQAVVSVAPVNLRTGPDISYPILRTLSEVGARYDIVGLLDSGGWWQVCCVAGETGWISEEGITIEGETARVPAVTAPNPQIRVQAERLNARTGPSTNYPTVTVLEAGETFDLIGRLNDGTWWQICCINGDPAWVIAEGVELWGNANLAPVVEIPPLPTSEPTN